MAQIRHDMNLLLNIGTVDLEQKFVKNTVHFISIRILTPLSAGFIHEALHSRVSEKDFR